MDNGGMTPSEDAYYDRQYQHSQGYNEGVRDTLIKTKKIIEKMKKRIPWGRTYTSGQLRQILDQLKSELKERTNE